MLIDSLPDFVSVIEALNVKDLLTKLETIDILPEIILIDVNMPKMDGVHCFMSQ